MVAFRGHRAIIASILYSVIEKRRRCPTLPNVAKWNRPSHVIVHHHHGCRSSQVWRPGCAMVDFHSAIHHPELLTVQYKT
ncbi:hypothetical protein NPIL_274291 [Nephila pilipes]|uniref:Uncharacterized protein n=1 Tax=Nephila pilipes TaxID=299642 RepID=A0A8X6TJX8_NEPPI|nr:hypothetical protein NPIL_93681 [Nephila pilipes]GFT30523.1 hypothetical protein NPIL_684271 [Nephila pilipes]GFT63356.1 hypothetical protein NPIL_274291 [Nephila pilipes]